MPTEHDATSSEICTGCGNGPRLVDSTGRHIVEPYPAELIWTNAGGGPNHGLCTSCRLSRKVKKMTAPPWAKTPVPGTPFEVQLHTTNPFATPAPVPPPAHPSTALAIVEAAPLAAPAPTTLGSYRRTVTEETRDIEAKIVKLRAFKIQNQVQRAALAASIEDTKKGWARLDAIEKKIVAEPSKILDEAREVFRPAKAAYRDLEAVIKERLRSFEVEAALAVDATFAEAQALSQAGNAEGARRLLMQAAELDSTVQQTPDGMQVRHPWTFEVKAKELLPSQFTLPDVKAIYAEMQEQLRANPNAVPVVPGVTFYRDIEVTASGKRKRGTK